MNCANALNGCFVAEPLSHLSCSTCAAAAPANVRQKSVLARM